jgi:hypothetical protein
MEAWCDQCAFEYLAFSAVYRKQFPLADQAQVREAFELVVEDRYGAAPFCASAPSPSAQMLLPFPEPAPLFRPWSEISPSAN